MGTFQIRGNAAANALPDARLVEIMRQTAAQSPYDVVMFSGYRPGTPRQGAQHASGNYLVDPKTGMPVPNLKSAYGFATYEQFAHQARAVQMAMYPTLEKTFRWGGYFSGGRGRYGSVDLMHFDIGP